VEIGGWGRDESRIWVLEVSKGGQVDVALASAAHSCSSSRGSRGGRGRCKVRGRGGKCGGLRFLDDEVDLSSETEIETLQTPL
jgi:hypothetical protein